MGKSLTCRRNNVDSWRDGSAEIRILRKYLPFATFGRRLQKEGFQIDECVGTKADAKVINEKRSV